MRLEILCMSKIDGFFADAVREYQKRLQPYCKITLSTQYKQTARSRRKGGQPGPVLLVDRAGERITSLGLAKTIERFSLEAYSDVLIVTDANFPVLGEPVQKICITQFDMDERLLTVILFEQIYRSFRILKGEPYHK